MDCFKTTDDEHDFFVKLADFWTTDLGLELIEVMRFKRDEYKNIVDATAQKLLTEDDFETFKPKIMKNVSLARTYNLLLDSELFNAEASKNHAEALRQDLIKD